MTWLTPYGGSSPERACPSRQEWPTFYSVNVRVERGPHWSARFQGLIIAHNPNGDTTLHSPVVDEARVQFNSQLRL